MEMEKKTKLKETIENLYNEIQGLNNKLQNTMLSIKDPSKMDKIDIGKEILKLGELNAELSTSIDLYLKYLGGGLEDFNTFCKQYYLSLKELKKPVSEIENEELKKFKELVNSKTNG